ncbi:prolyl oligopeptidase family serine peptidase [Thalassobacillus devorans]|uniref:prolyl oligopeptidase family serine peptidase n=1 Tax=Thalassobacillus devorans TaxID=279813 RepID=UPI0034E97EE5
MRKVFEKKGQRDMVTVYREFIEEIPVLVIVEAEKYNQPLPVVTYFHGFTSAKEHNLAQAYLLARKGFRVLLPDSMYHGEREVDQTQEELQFKFWDIVLANLDELKTIKTAIDEKGWTKGKRFVVAGTSMGGVTTAAALTQFPWVDGAAVMMGSPKPVEFAEKMLADVRNMGVEMPITAEEVDELMSSLAEIDLSRQMEKLHGRPIFFWHGDADPVVPFEHSYDFYNEAIQHYKNPENIRFLREIGKDHKVTRFAILEMVDWMDHQFNQE